MISGQRVKTGRAAAGKSGRLVKVLLLLLAAAVAIGPSISTAAAAAVVATLVRPERSRGTYYTRFLFNEISCDQIAIFSRHLTLVLQYYYTVHAIVILTVFVYTICIDIFLNFHTSCLSYLYAFCMICAASYNSLCSWSDKVRLLKSRSQMREAWREKK